MRTANTSTPPESDEAPRDSEGFVQLDDAVLDWFRQRPTLRQLMRGWLSEHWHGRSAGGRA